MVTFPMPTVPQCPPSAPLTPPQDPLQMVPAAAWAWTWTLLLLPLLLPAALGDNATLDQVPGSGGPPPPPRGFRGAQGKSPREGGCHTGM